MTDSPVEDSTPSGSDDARFRKNVILVSLVVVCSIAIAAAGVVFALTRPTSPRDVATTPPILGPLDEPGCETTVEYWVGRITDALTADRGSIAVVLGQASIATDPTGPEFQIIMNVYPQAEQEAIANGTAAAAEFVSQQARTQCAMRYGDDGEP